MLYISQLLGVPVFDLAGERIGKVSDLLISRAHINEHSSGQAAQANALLVEGPDDPPWYVPGQAARWRDTGVHLRVPTEQLARRPETTALYEVSLSHEVLDKQVIDLRHKKAVRVNDVYLDEHWQILGIDHSALGVLRRLAPAWLLGASSKRVPANLLPWNEVELLGPQFAHEEDEEPAAQSTAGRVEAVLARHRSQSGQLAELRPADIADIVHQLTPAQGARLLEGLDDEIAADALEEIDTERQSYILENIAANRAADILEAMGPDEAADLLARLPEERAAELLGLMNPEESGDVQDLLAYEEDSAGGLMTTDYIALSVTKSVAEALAAIRSGIAEDIRAAYVYCVPDENQENCSLLGTVSVWELLAAPPEQLLRELMETDFVTVKPDTDPREVAEVMAKYNLLAVPVVNAEGFLEGIVTVDDALDVLLPAERRRKPTRMY